MSHDTPPDEKKTVQHLIGEFVLFIVAVYGAAFAVVFGATCAAKLAALIF